MVFIDHISLGVTNLARSARLYDALAAALGAGRFYETEDMLCYGTSLEGWLALNLCNDATRPVIPSNGSHICFAAADIATVAAFHAAGLANGATDNGTPGYRPKYGEGYYGAFLVDPDGHRLGVVCRTSESG